MKTFAIEIYVLFIYELFRFVNDSPELLANVNVKRHLNKNGVFIAMFASRDIAAGDELRYEYSIL